MSTQRFSERPLCGFYCSLFPPVLVLFGFRLHTDAQNRMSASFGFHDIRLFLRTQTRGGCVCVCVRACAHECVCVCLGLDKQVMFSRFLPEKTSLVGPTGLLRVSFLVFFFCFLGPHLWHLEVPKLEVESALQPPAYTTATAMRDLSRVCDLPHSSWQRRILSPPREARDQTRVLMDTSRVHNTAEP